MLYTDFNEIDNKFARFQMFLRKPVTKEEQRLHQVILATLAGNQKDMLKQADEELNNIRQFYLEQFSQATDNESQARIIKQYNNVYVTLYKITANEISAADAMVHIRKNTDNWRNSICVNNILNVCVAITLVMPIIASLLILPFALPILSVSPLLGIALLMSSSTAICLCLHQLVNTLSNIEFSGPVIENSQVELSFFSKMTAGFNSGHKKIDANILTDSYDESMDIFAPA